MKNLVCTALVLALLTGSFLTANAIAGTDHATLGTSLTVSKMTGLINWKAGGGRPPVGRGSFLLKASTPVGMLNLLQLKDAMAYLFFNGNVWPVQAPGTDGNDVWTMKSTSKKRTWTMINKVTKDTYKVVLTLKNGILNIMVKDKRSVTAAMFDAVNVDTGGVITKNYNIQVTWLDTNDTSMVNAVCTLPCDFQTKVDNKTTIKNQ
ncbi:MAG: hypothetical protein NTV22_16900 [bacterium]|nr:hypothetical protein [bacterium]